ncbi:MAG: hypothetical protein LBM96_07540 [Methanobrevibacter sp.]|jgi:hypothetical protein|nr:hypothetical protein [Candidatus Methanoflexus mossambicus]
MNKNTLYLIVAFIIIVIVIVMVANFVSGNQLFGAVVVPGDYIVSEIIGKWGK